MVVSPVLAGGLALDGGTDEVFEAVEADERGGTGGGGWMEGPLCLAL